MKLSLGLDIGKHSIKLIELAIEKKTAVLTAAGTVPTPAGETDVLVQTISKLIKDAGVKAKEVHLALPESQVFTRVIEVPVLSQRELSSAIQWEAEQYIPLPLAEVNVDYSVLSDPKTTGGNKMSVLLVAAPKKLVERYLTVCELVGLSPVSAETEVIATIRATSASIANVKSAIILSLGGQTSDIAIIKGGMLTFTRSLAIGGDAFTRALASGLDLSNVQAEEYKKTYGVQPDKLEGKILATLHPMLETIVAELKRALVYYKEKYHEESVATLLLSGGTSRVPGMVPYFAGALGLDSQLVDPWRGITKDVRFSVLNGEGPTFCVAVGLALRDMYGA